MSTRRRNRTRDAVKTRTGFPVKANVGRWGALLLVVGLLALAFGPGGPAGSGVSVQAQQGEKSAPSPNVDSALAQLLGTAQSARASAQGVAQQASRAGIPVEGNAVIVVAEVSGPAAAIASAVARTLGSDLIVSASRSFLKVRIPLTGQPLELLLKLAELSGIRFVRPPLVPAAQVVSEGVALTGASLFHSNGVRGQGVKIAIIDLGFAGLSAAQARGELPANVLTFDFTGTGIEGTTSHGTAVAEIVYDMAPNAQLLLMKVADEVGLENAVDEAIRQGVQIINHSVAWFNTNFYDGTGPIAAAAQRARSAGIVWVNAAGNYARRHWQGFASDGDGDGWAEFAPGVEGLQLSARAGEPVQVFLTWNDWPRTSQDYDLYVVNSSGAIVAASERLQNGTQPPTETLFFTAPATDTYEIRVRPASVSVPYALSIFNLNQDLTPSVASGSIVTPADCSCALAVGSVSFQNWTTGPLDPFSSQGPTPDGRLKPDLVGPSGVTVSTSGWNPFFGTSAAAPHVAGAAALLLSENPSLGAAQLEAKLKGDAIPMGSATQYGAGRLNLTPSIAQRPDLTLVNATFTPASPRIGDFITVTAQVQNRGNAAAGPFAVQLQDSFGTLQQSFSGLAAGASASVSFQRQVRRTQDTITLVVDPLGQVDESDETNNAVQLTVRAQQVPQLPDLVITGTSFSPPNPRVGDTVSFAITVANQGNAAAGPFAVDLRGSAGTSRVNLSGLAAGGSVQLSFQQPLSASVETFTAIVDPFHQVSEADENNNTAQITVQGQSPPALSVDIDTDRKTYFVGDPIGVTFTTSADGYVYVYDVNPQGYVQILYPQTESGNAFLRAGTYDLAELLGVSHLQVAPPTGMEHLHAVLADRPLNLGLHGLQSPSLTDPNTFRSAIAQRIQTINPSTLWAWDVAAFAISDRPDQNRPPIARFTYSPSSPVVNQVVTFDGSSSSDPDGTIVEWRWVFEGTTVVEARGVRVNVRFTTARTYRVTLTVTDNQGATGSTTQTIEVLPSQPPPPPQNQPPVARFTFSPQNPQVNELVTFDGRGSSDPDGTIVRYSWDLNGDGRVDALGSVIQARYSRAGTYTVTLTVTDDRGATGSISQTITVGGSPPPPPPPPPPTPEGPGFYLRSTEPGVLQIVLKGDPSWTTQRDFRIQVRSFGGEFARRPEAETTGGARSSLVRFEDTRVFMSGWVREGEVVYTVSVRFFTRTQKLEFLLELDTDGDGDRERWPQAPAYLWLEDRIVRVEAESDNGVFSLVSEGEPLLPFRAEHLNICGEFLSGRTKCKPVE